MIYDFGSYSDVFLHMKNNLPSGTIKVISKLNKLESLVTEEDMVIFYGWTPGFREVQRKLVDKGVLMYPSGESSLFLGDKVKQLKFADMVTKYPLERVYDISENLTKRRMITVPKLENSRKVVMKIGNSHQGRDKYLEVPGYVTSVKESVIFEEFVKDARSIRVIIIDTENVFLVEQTNSDSPEYLSIKNDWIKNICPVEHTVIYKDRYSLGIGNIDEIIEDAKRLASELNVSNYVGVDYVVTESKTGLLEINDMIGLPEVPIVREVAKDYWLKVCKRYLEGVEYERGR